MHNKRKALLTGLALCVSLSLLFANAPVVKSWSGNLMPLLQAYYWSSSNSTATGWFNNTSSTGIGVVGYNGSGSSGQGVQGANHGTSGYGVIGYNSQNIGVFGVGGSGSGDYGGYFDGFEGVRGVAHGSNGYGTWGVASGSYGIGAVGVATGSYGYGMYGYSSYYYGVIGVGGTGSGDVGGYFTAYNGVQGVASGSAGRGVYGYAPWEGVRGVATATSGWGVYGQATNNNGYGGVFMSSYYRGLYADGASGWYDGVFPDMIYVGGTVISSLGTAFTAVNDGSQALEPGDLVAFSRFVASAEDSAPALAVTRADGANSHAVLGVVQSAYVKEEIPAEATHMQGAAQALAAPAGIEKEVAPIPDPLVVGEDGLLQALPMESQPEAVGVAPGPAMEETSSAASPVSAEAGHFVEGSAQPGQYVVLMVQGITRVKVDASAAPIRAGDTLVASAAGYAVNAALAAQPDEAAQPRKGAGDSGDRGSPGASSSQVLTIGRALESLETGTGTIYVFVSVR
jgi:hypothetical protein